MGTLKTPQDTFGGAPWVSRGGCLSRLIVNNKDSPEVLAGDAHLMVGVEFYPEDNEVVGKVYVAESQLKYATEHRDAHLAGSVRATVSHICIDPQTGASLATKRRNVQAGSKH